jgi:hypothetical protein
MIVGRPYLLNSVSLLICPFALALECLGDDSVKIGAFGALYAVVRPQHLVNCVT